MNLKVFVIPILILWGYSALGQWISNPFPFLQTSYSVQVSGNTLIASAFNEIYKSTDGGKSWILNPVQFTNYDPEKSWLFFITRVIYVSESLAYSFNNAAGIVTIFKSVDGGSNWTLVHYSNGSIQNMQWVSPSVGYAVGSAGKILKTSDGGDTWVDLAPPAQSDLRGLHFLDANNGVVVGNQLILKTTNGGDSWTSIPTFDENLNSVFLISSRKGYTVGSNGIKPFTFDSTGELKFNFDYNHVASSRLYYTDSLTGYFYSSNGLFKTVDGGKFWSQQKNTGGYQISQFDFYGKSTGLFVGQQIDFPYTKRIFSTVTGGDPMPENDARLLAVNEYSSNLCRGEYPIKVRVVNEGINNLTSANLQWSVNGVEQSFFRWTGNLLPGDTSELFQVGVYNFSRTAFDYNVVVWTDQPNNSVDDNVDNDLTSVTYRFNIFGGTYFVGGSDNDFDKVSDAIQLMKIYGVCDDIIFVFRNGTYENDPIIINDPIYQLSGDRKLIFQSESGSPNDVTLLYSTGTAISVGSIPDISFRNLGIEAHIEISLTADSVKVENCILKNTSVSGDISNIVLGYNTKSVLFRGNVVEGGYASVSNVSGNPNFSTGEWKFEGNTFNDQRYAGIYFESSLHRKVLISQNKFFSDNCYRYTGLHLNSATEAFVVNNYVQAFSSIDQSYITGIFANYGNVKIYHNTIVVSGVEGGVPISISRTDPVIIKNNNLVTLSNGPVYMLSQDEHSVIDYNNIFSPYGAIFELDNVSTYSQNLAAWQAISGHDQNSISIDPQLVHGEVHVPLSTSNYALNGAGTPLNEVFTDIDGDLRDAQHPDIGADEFTIPLVDLGLTALSHGEQVCSGNVSHRVRVNNFGQTDVDTYTVYWSINGQIQSPVILNSINAGSHEDVNLGFSSFSAGIYTIDIWVETFADEIVRNNSLSMTITVGGMSGVFSIGGNSPDYPTISSAIEAVKTKGVCGNVLFNIRSGTYTDTIVIPSILGASETSQIIFQSEAQDSSSVTLHVSSPIVLDGADWITLRHFSVMSSSVFSSLIELKDGANHNTISGNHFSAYLPGSTFIYSSSESTNEFNSIKGNSFVSKNLHYVMQFIVLRGQLETVTSPRRYERGNVVFGNTFFADDSHNDNSYNVVEMGYQDGFIFSDNIVRNESNMGVLFHNCLNRYLVSGNQITAKHSAVIIDQSLDFGYAPISIVSNNIIESKEGVALNLRGVNRIGLYNNTVIGGNGPFVVNVNSLWWNLADKFEAIEIKNNIIISKAGGACLSLGINTSAVSDYNVFYAENDNPFALLKSNTWLDNPRSELFDGLFQWQSKTEHDLHSLFFLPRFVSEIDYHINNDYRLKSKGIAVGVLKDIDGDTRDIIAPDIGADEFIVTPIPNDAGVSSAVRPDECTTTPVVKVKIKNYGSNQLAIALIHWRVNEITMPPVSWNGLLNPGEESEEVFLGQFPLYQADSAYVKVWTEAPNGTTDLESINDTLLIDNIYQKLSGFYTLGGDDADFPTFNSALDYLHRVGVCGSVVFEIMPGIYNEELKWTEIKGASVQDRVTFLPYTDSVIINGHWYWQNKIKDIDHITFKNLTFSNLSFEFSGECNDIEFISNKFKGGDTQYFQYLTFTDGQFSDLVIDGNDFESGWRAISATLVRNAVIQNNTIDSISVGIDLRNAMGSTVVYNNKLNVGDYGLRLGTVSGSVNVIGNSILNYNHGIWIEHSGSFTESSIVANNMIHGLNYGIFSQHNINFKFYHNSVLVENKLDSTRGYAAFASLNDSLIHVINNSFVNTTVSDWLYSGMAIHIDDLHKPSSIFDYNNLWSKNGKYRYDNITIFDFETYQVETGLEPNSISVNPLYVSATDLHVLNPALNGKGIPLNEVSIDFDGEPRDLWTPDIGADEFDESKALKTLDIGILTLDDSFICDAASSVSFNLENFGAETITSFKIDWQINDQFQPQETWTGTLEYGAKNAYSIPRPELPPGVHTLKISISQPNESDDQADENNDIELTFAVYPSVELTSDVIQCSQSISSVTFDAGYFQAYEWNDGSTTQSITVTDTGLYSVVVTDANGCISSDDVSLIREFVETNITSSDGDAFCDGSTTTLFVKSGGSAYLWYRDGMLLHDFTSEQIDVNIEGGYHVTILTPNCSFQSEIVHISKLESPPKPTILSDGPTEFCEGNSITLSSDQTYFDYLWSDGQSTSSIVVSESGNYVVTGISVNGCSSLPSDEIEIVVNKYPQAFITESNGVLSSTPGEKYQWYLNNSAIDGAVNQFYAPVESGVYRVEVSQDDCSKISDEFDFVITSVEASSSYWDFVYPNPVNHYLTIKCAGLASSNIQFFNNLGKRIVPSAIEFKDDHIVVHTTDIKSGLYLLALALNGETKYFRIVVLH